MKDFKAIFKEKEVDYIQFHFTTLFGELKSVEFPADIWEEMHEGSGVDGSSLGFLKTEQSDMRVVPDLDTFAVLPWDLRVGRFICDIHTNDGFPHPTDPRSILKKGIQSAKAMGFEYKTRPELEWFFVLDDYTPADDGVYMDTLPFDSLALLRRTIADDMRDMDISVKTIHHECGLGQQEIELGMDDALIQADNSQTSKMIIKTESVLEGLIGTFMPKPFHDQAGNGLHIHQFLTRDGVNIFSDEEKGISDSLRYFVGGILEHVDAMTAFFNPTTNSYKRLVPGHEAPVFKSWGVANRTALIRVPGYEKKARIEYRAADGATNIYFAKALLLAAGLDGIRRKIEPIPPTTKNVEKLTSEERKEMGITQLPSDLNEALDFMEKSQFIQEVLGKEIVDIYLDVKRREYKEYLDIKSKGFEAVKEWENKKYLERV